MDDRYKVSLIGGDEDEQAVFTLTDEGDGCMLRCEYRGKAIERMASDYFEALIRVRRVLADEGLIPFCYGASLNVYPSGMARNMGQGLQAYKLAISHPAKLSDLVEVFAEGLDVIPASVAEQEQFFRDWLASLQL